MFQKKPKKLYSLTIIAILLVFSLTPVFAQEEPFEVDYEDKVIVDSDLDGLTDEGEKQLYGTDPMLPDSDGDGFYDSVEVLSGTDPANYRDPNISRTMAVLDNALGQEIPWAWYLSRSSGFLGYIFLWLAILFGLSIRNNLLKKIIGPIYSFSFHTFLAVSGLFWAFFHGVSFMFHDKHPFSFLDSFLPFYMKSGLVNSGMLAFGILAFYGMVVLTVTSYARKYMSHKLWRITHFLHPIVFVIIVIHGFKIGTDMANETVKAVFLASAWILVLLYFSSLFFVFWNKYAKKNETPSKD